MWVNRGAGEWSVAGRTLPAFCLYARVPAGSGTVEAAIERRGEATVEWARSPAFIYVNPRGTQPVSFDGITANGGFRLTEGELTPLPDSPAFTVRLSWSSLPWKKPAPRQAEAIAEDGRLIRRIDLRTEDGQIVLECEPGIFTYRFRWQSRLSH